MLDFSKPPFPENPACKNCVTRPCKQLFTGRVYPGKMIFVHRRDFIFLPCHQPNFLKNQEEKTEEVALTDELAETMTDEKKPVNVTNPRWEHVDEEKKSTTPDTAAIGDEVNLYVDVTGVPEGSRVNFDIFDVSSDPPFRIATASGKNEQGTACGKWSVEDPSNKGDELKIGFEGVAKSKASERCPVGVTIPCTGGTHLVFEDPQGHAPEGVAVKVTAGGEEVYAGTIDTGVICLSGIPFAELALECTFAGRTVQKDLHWNGGNPPYTKELVHLTTPETNGEAA